MCETHHKILSIILDEKTVPFVGQKLEHERHLYITEMIEDAVFQHLSDMTGPYHIILSLYEQKVSCEIISDRTKDSITHIFSLSPFLRLMRDYRHICDHYKDAVLHGSVQKIETLDMARRGIHNEAARLLEIRLSSKITMNFEGFRKFFSLLVAMTEKSSYN